MFNLVSIGERAGSGIPNIYSVWEKQGWKLPELSESYDPDRITLSLAIEKTSDKKQAIKTSDKNKTEKQSRMSMRLAPVWHLWTWTGKTN